MTRVDACENLGANRQWVILETGSNQSFIFATNKQRVNVGASELVRRSCDDWVNDAIAGLPDSSTVTPVVRASGKAILLVRDADVGRRLITAVTTRALTDAPGLELWGTVGPEVAADFSDAPETLRQAHRIHGQCRGFKRPTRGRQPVLPMLRTCAVGSGPAQAVKKEWAEQEQPPAVSPQVAAAWALSTQARGRLTAELPGAESWIDQVVPDLRERGQELGHDGWIAVVHADGNKIGELFRNLGQVYRGAEFVRKLATFSEAIDRVTRDAFGNAVTRVPAPSRGWLLPLILGGDNLTFLADGRVALRLVREFQTEFAEASAGDPVIAEVTGKVRRLGSPDAADADVIGLTASAGIAYVKPHHPFSDAYDLVEQLVVSAKGIGGPPKGTSALDFHVCYESVSTPLRQVRERQLTSRTPDRAADLRLWAGPYRVTADAQSSGAPDGLGRLRAVADLLGVDVFEVGDAIRDGESQDTNENQDANKPALSNAAAHALRAALLVGGEEITRVRDRITVVSKDAAPAIPAELLIFENPDDPAGPGKRTHLLDALTLIDVLTGTGQHTDDPSTAEPATIGATS